MEPPEALRGPEVVGKEEEAGGVAWLTSASRGRTDRRPPDGQTAECQEAATLCTGDTGQDEGPTLGKTVTARPPPPDKREAAHTNAD